MKNYFRVVRSAKKYTPTFIGALVCLTLLNVFEGFSLFTLVPIIDRVFGGGQVIITESIKIPLLPPVRFLLEIINQLDRYRLLVLLGIFVLTMFFLKGIFYYGEEILMERMGQGVVRNIRSKIYQHIQDLSLDYSGTKRTGELVSRITNDVRWVQEGIARGLANTLDSFFKLILYLTIIFVIACKLSLITLVVFGLLMVPIIKIGKLLRKISAKGQAKMADLSSLLYETISGMRIVKAFAMEDYEYRRFQSENNRYYQLMMKAIRRAAIVGPLVEFVGALVAVGILLIVAPTIISGTISIGWFALYIGALVAVMKPVKKISQMNPIIQRAAAASDRIYEILDTEPKILEVVGAQELSPINERIRFINMNFGYQGKEVLLKDINLDIKKGQLIAFVGPSGVGKTSLLNLIPRFYDPLSGRVEIDDIDIRYVTLRSLREQLGMVSQETILFNDTVWANIAYGEQSRDMAEVIRAAEMANAHHFIVQLPRGYGTVIGERGFNLSGGERQRIAIARAILKNPRILILDEATSALDTESERLVQDALDKLMKNRTVLVIAHRLSTVQQADCIYVLKDGRIIDGGRHQELIAREGPYRTLYQLQIH